MGIPLKLKWRLIEFARRLPQHRRARFLIDTSKKIAAFAASFALEHKYAVTGITSPLTPNTNSCWKSSMANGRKTRRKHSFKILRDA